MTNYAEYTTHHTDQELKTVFKALSDDYRDRIEAAFNSVVGDLEEQLFSAESRCAELEAELESKE